MWPLAGASLTVRADTPMSYLRTYGPAADPIARLNWGLMTVSVLVVLAVGGLVVAAALRRRGERSTDVHALSVRRDGGGMQWIYVGVGISTVVLFACTIWTLVTLSAVAAPPQSSALTIRVTANQWWWAVRYDDGSARAAVVTANEIHVPVGVPARFELSSNDVIHSFWIPQLAGKTDVIPGQTNVAWLQADQPGVYRGQCAEYCGLQHAGMALRVIADEPEAFRSWLEKQAGPADDAAMDADPDAKQVFMAHCSVCHTVRGTDAGGVLGPDLTHLMSRRTLAAGALPNDPGHLAQWVADPQSVKPGCRMPDLALSGADLERVLAFLNTLH